MLESSRTATLVVPTFVSVIIISLLLLLPTNDFNTFARRASTSPTLFVSGATISHPNHDQHLDNHHQGAHLNHDHLNHGADHHVDHEPVPSSNVQLLEETPPASQKLLNATDQRLPAYRVVRLPAEYAIGSSDSQTTLSYAPIPSSSPSSSSSLSSTSSSSSSSLLVRTTTDLTPNRQQQQISFHHSSAHSNATTTKLNLRSERVKRVAAAAAAATQDLNQECEFQGGSRKPAIYGVRCDEAEVTEESSVVIRAFTPTKVYLIGRNLYSNLTIAITEQDGAAQDDCTHVDRIRSLRLTNLNPALHVAEIHIELPPPEKDVPYYFCLREDTPDSRWYHQGSESWLKIHVKQDLLPLWTKPIIIAMLLGISGLFSGLNLGLMALDKNELQVIMKCGSEDEKRYAASIEPVRRRGNYMLCSILLSNTLVNSCIAINLGDLFSGLVATIFSTLLIVMFGEILPQAFCSRHGLAVGAKTIWLTRACMFITAPLSYAISYCLDWALGEEIGHAYDRERLMEFIQVTRDINNLEADEVNIISGALKIKRVQISEVMTRIEDVYMLDENAVLDFDTIQAIVGKGYSRIPVHESGNRRNIKAVLFAKDLALVDPDDRTPVQTMINFYNHPRMFVFEDTTLDKALNEFKTGKSHMAIVQRVTDDGDRDPYYEITGIVTLEDVIEEIMQMEINDETDTLTDNRRKRRRKDAQVRKDFSQFTNLGTGDSSFNVVTPQLCLAAYQYLATTVEPFTAKFLSDSILRRLLSQKIFYKVRLDDDQAVKRLYTAGEPADYFIMILEGRVHVICGKENLVFDGGPFSFFGKAALIQYDNESSIQQQQQLTAAITNSTSPSAAVGTGTPGHSAISAGVATSSTTPTPTQIRRDSLRPMLSRRESLAKIVTSQLSLASKKVADSEQTQVAELSPTHSPAIGGMTEAVELHERGSYYFKPDYTVDVIANTSFLKVTRNDYITALRATCVERESAVLLGEDPENTMIMDNSQMFSVNNPAEKDG